MEKKVSVNDVSEAILELFKANGVDYIFQTTGFPNQELYSKYKALGKGTPEVISNLQEALSVSAAMGYFMITGKPQVATVFSGLGLQLVSAQVQNAQHGQIGVIVCASRTDGSAVDGHRL